MEPTEQEKPQVTDIKELRYGEAGDWFGAEPIIPADMPPWLDVSHPEFPKYFEFTAFDKNGAPYQQLQRCPDRYSAEGIQFWDRSDEHDFYSDD